MKKMPGDIIILLFSTKNDKHMMYGSWDMECDRKKKFFFILIIFCPFTTLTLNIKIFKKLKKKNTRIYHHFIQVYHKWQSYNIWFLRYEVWQTEFFVILGHALPFYPITTQNINILKKRKNKKKKKKKTPGDMWVPHLKKLLL